MSAVAETRPGDKNDNEALTAIQEAVTICRELTTTNPTAHNPELARSLNNLSLVLEALGREDEAEAAAIEAAQIRADIHGL